MNSGSGWCAFAMTATALLRLRERTDPYYTYGIHYIPVPRHCVVMLVAATADWCARSARHAHMLFRK